MFRGANGVKASKITFSGAWTFHWEPDPKRTGGICESNSSDLRARFKIRVNYEKKAIKEDELT